MRTLQTLLKSPRGSVAVEFALFLPLLLILIFGVVELGSAWYAKQMMVNASREGARLGSLYTASGISDQDVVAHVETVLNNAGFSSPVSITSIGAGGATGQLVRVEVNAAYSFPVLSALIPAVEPVNLNAATVMRHE